MKRIFAFLLGFSGVLSSFAQVSPQNGSATFGIPMFNWVDNRSRLNLSIGLQYNSGSGLKVAEIASSVGQGWNLMAGGVISRMKVGEADDQKFFEEETLDDLNKYPNGYWYDNVGVDKGCPIALTRYPIYKDKNHLYKQHNEVAADKELDRFAYQFNGKSGIFVLRKGFSEGYPYGEFLGDTKMQVWFETDEIDARAAGIRTTISAFYIRDDNGIVYKFSNREKTKVLKFNYCDWKFNFHQTQPKFKEGEVSHEATVTAPDPLRPGEIAMPYVVNSWYLEKINDPFGNREIQLTYENHSINSTGAFGISYYWEKDYAIVSHITSQTETPAIKSIIFPDSHTVEFKYGLQDRADLPGAHALESITIKYDTRVLSTFKLTTSYFMLKRYGTPTTALQRKTARLCLLEVTKSNVDQKSADPPYRFDYYMGSNLPDDVVPPQFAYRKDVWGYYNGDASKRFNGSSLYAAYDQTKPVQDLDLSEIKGLVFLRNNTGQQVTLNAKPGYAKNGLLKTILYPTGGTITYEYEQNKGMLNGTIKDVGGVHVSKTSVTDGGYSNDCTNPIVTNYNYADSSGQSSMWGLESPKTSVTMTSHYEPYDKYFFYRPILSFGCDYRYQYPGILAREQSVSLTSGQQFMFVLSKVLDVVSGIMTVIDVVSLCLKATPAAWVAVILDIIASVVTVIITCTKDMSQDDTTIIFYDSDLNGSNPLPTQFKRVVVTEGNGSNGKTVMEFTSDDDYTPWIPDNLELTMAQRFPYWAYGLPKRTTVFNAANQPVKETISDYNWNLAKRGLEEDFNGQIVNNFNNYKCKVERSTSQPNTAWQHPNNFSYANAPANYTTTGIQDVLTVKNYKMFSGRTELKSTTERVYKPNSSQYLETKTEYSYESNSYLVRSIKTTQSNGDQNIKEIYYSSEYAGILFTVYGVPVREVSSIIKYGTSQKKYLGQTVTEYIGLLHNEVKPFRKLQERFSSPQTSISPYNGSGETTVPANFKVIESYTHDYNGNLVGMKDEGDHIISNLYDYKNRYLVASVINADPLADKSAYSSFETDNMGGWTLNGTRTPNSTLAITGKNSLNLSTSAGNSLTAPINTAKAYRLSFWSTALLTVSNATLQKSEPVRNGFTYYEYAVAQGTSSVSVSGNATIDELRLCPQTARMRTTTYDPLIGKTDECDENNRITYYEYDNRDRLRMVKDDEGNVIKMYEYGYEKNRPSACNVTYYNRATTEMIERNNCTVDQQPGKYEYVIPAGKYSSTISQATADILAENELNTLGQTTANNSAICSTLYKNAAVSQTFAKQGCEIGYAGTSLTYSVPLGRYTSTVSQAAADQMATDDINANGQGYVNNLPGASCTLSTTAVWEGTGLSQCQYGRRLVQVKDINPNSNSHDQTQYVDTGYDATCTPQPAAYSIINTSTCNSANTSFIVTGHTGDVIELKLRFAAQLSWSGSFGGTGATITLSGPNTFNSQFSPHYTSFQVVDINCTITIVMTSPSVTVNTTVNTHNSIGANGGPTLSIVSVNGSPYNSTGYPCYYNTNGYW